VPVAANNLDEELIADFGTMSDDPLSCALYSFDWGVGDLQNYAGPKTWQADIMTDIRDHLHSDDRFTPLLIAVASGHGIGKSALIGMLQHWAMSTMENTRIVLTANTGQQLDTKTWPEVSKWFRLAINAHWWEIKGESISVRDKADAENWRIDAVTWSDNNTAAFAGLHNEGKRILVIMDEASEISDKVWEVTEGALTDENTEIIWIAFGNPTVNTGRFRECFGRYKHRWLARQIDSRKVEGTNKAQIQKWVQDYGEDSDFVRVRVRGEFPRAGSSQFIDGERVSAARKRVVEAAAEETGILAVDVARFGDDQSVWGYRRGNLFQIVDTARGLATDETAARTVQWQKRLQPRATVIDGDGIGAGVVDDVRKFWREKRIAKEIKQEPDIHEFHGASSPDDPDMYYNRRAECWGLARDWLLEGSIPDDPELDSDLTGPNYTLPTNKILLEKKEDMKKRGLSSPDKGDTLAMSLSVTPRPLSREELHERAQQKVLSQGDYVQANWNQIHYAAQKSVPFQVTGGRRR
jgi:hypothetical protein